MNEAVIAPIVGLTDSGVDADLGGHPGDDELLDSMVLEYRVQVGSEEGAFARLVNHRLGRQRVEFRNDVVSGFATYQDAAHRANITDAGLAPATGLHGWWEVSQIRTMAFAGVHDLQPDGAPRCQQLAVGLDGAA